MRLRALKLLSGADSHWPNVYIYVSLYALGCGLVDLRLSSRVCCVYAESRKRGKKRPTQVGSSNYPKALSIIKIITHAKIIINSRRAVSFIGFLAAAVCMKQPVIFSTHISRAATEPNVGMT